MRLRVGPLTAQVEHEPRYKYAFGYTHANLTLRVGNGGVRLSLTDGIDAGWSLPAYSRGARKDHILSVHLGRAVPALLFRLPTGK